MEINSGPMMTRWTVAAPEAQGFESSRGARSLDHWTVMPSWRIIAMKPVMEKKIAMAVSPYVTAERSSTNERSDDEIEQPEHEARVEHQHRCPEHRDPDEESSNEGPPHDLGVHGAEIVGKALRERPTHDGGDEEGHEKSRRYRRSVARSRETRSP